jgi:hypothetical protein
MRHVRIALGEAFQVAAPDNRLQALPMFEDGDAIVVEGVYTGSTGTTRP